MQGAWQVTVAGKSAAFAQRVVVRIGRQTQYHDGVESTQFDVRGERWSIGVEFSPDGQTWHASAIRLQGSSQPDAHTVALRIGSNDGGPDGDYDDLVLECTTTLATHEHFIYGRVREHDGCLFGCGYPSKYLVIDSWAALESVQSLAAGERVLERVRPKFQPKSELMTPVMIPIEPSKAAGLAHDADLRTLINFGSLARRRCKVRALPEQVLAIYEYDRTDAERLGGPYTGTGVRVLLGYTSTDERGYYVFRFTRTLADMFEEIFTDMGSAEPSVAFRPDLIIATLDGAGTAFYETALHDDVAQVQRIDVCLPKSQRPASVELVPGGRYIQLLGDINLLSANVTLADGMISNVSPPAGAGPVIEQGAWSGRLRLAAMFPSTAARYALRTRTRDGGNVGRWRWHAEGYTRFSRAANTYEDIGPSAFTIADPDHPGQTVDIPTYANIYGNPDWQQANACERAYLSTPTLRSTPGLVEVEVHVWDAGGAWLGHDGVSLYVDDGYPQGKISKVEVSGAGPSEPHECPLLELQPSERAAKLAIHFELHDSGGFLDKWSMVVHRGKNTELNRMSERVPASNRFLLSESRVINPPDGSNWLPNGHDLCAFSFTLTAQSRRTDGRAVHGPHEVWRELVAIAQR
jgi:hypothetical protein